MTFLQGLGALLDARRLRVSRNVYYDSPLTSVIFSAEDPGVMDHGRTYVAFPVDTFIGSLRCGGSARSKTIKRRAAICFVS